MVGSKADAGPSADSTRPHDLNALGVIGLRLSDLQEENIACCGDCERFALVAGDGGAVRATCALGYATTLYSPWAAICPGFSVRAPLPDAPQEDERSRRERRTRGRAVTVERRLRPDRRQSQE
jgi:hypothetical protein